MSDSITVASVELVCSDVYAKIANVEAEVKEIEDGLDMLMHAVDSQALKDFMNCIKYKAKNLCDVSLAETYDCVTDLEVGITMLKEQTVQLGTLPGLTNQVVENSEGDIVELEKPVQKRRRRKKNDINVDEVQKENASTLEELFNNEDGFMKVQ